KFFSRQHVLKVWFQKNKWLRELQPPGSDSFLHSDFRSSDLKILISNYRQLYTSSQSFQTASYPCRRIISAISAGLRSSLISNCSKASIPDAYPPGSVLDPALIEVIPRRII